MSGDRVTRRGLLAAAGTVLAGGLAGCETPTGTGGSQSDPVESPEIDGLPTGSGEGNAYTTVYAETVESVVLISTTSPSGQGQGSGFVFRDASRTGGKHYLVTNEHVVRGADEIEIQYSREDWRTGAVTGADYYSDLAVVEVEDPPEYAEALPLVEREPPIGTRIVAIGSPFGLEKSLTSGIISGTNRSMPANYSTTGGFSIPDAVQTDAALNPGNSGGPLLTLSGRVVGVVRAGQGDNIGFGISAAITRRVATSLVENGDYEHSYMGVGVSPVTPAVAETNDLDTTRGVFVGSVSGGGDSGESGPSEGILQEGDVVTALGETTVDTRNDFSTFLALETSPGDTIEVTVRRDGEERTFDLTLGTRPPPSPP